MAHALEFRKGGILIHHEWVYDDEKGKGQYVEKDITDNWFHRRDLPCKLGPGVTLNDVFLFVDREPEICDMIFVNSFAKALWQDWKKVFHQTRIMRPTDHYSPDDIEFLELYWNPEIHNWDGVDEIDGAESPCCHGLGYELREDKFEKWQDTPFFNKGYRIPWAIDFAPLITLIDLPILLNEKFEIRDDWRKHKNDMSNVPKLLSCNKKFSFEQIIGGLLWELSFYGTEDEKTAKCDELNSMAEELELTQNTEGNIINK
jgi:hypothetical protein